MSKICTACGAMNKDSASICVRCKKALNNGFNGSGYGNSKSVNSTVNRNGNYSTQNSSYAGNMRGRNMSKIYIRTGIAVVVVILIVFLLVHNSSTSIIGTWKGSNGEGMEMTMVFNENYTGVVGFTTFTWTNAGDNKYYITVKDAHDGQDSDFVVEQHGRELVWQNSDDEWNMERCKFTKS